jgi:hypothetical protein
MCIVDSNVCFRKRYLLAVFSLPAWLWCASSHSLFGQVLLTHGVTPNSNAPPNSQYVGSFTNPTDGRQYDRYLTYESVPAPRTEYEEKIEKRWVPHMVTENMQVPQTQYVPYVQLQPQTVFANDWNPFTPPQPTMVYSPVTQYQAVTQVATQPVQQMKYVEQDFKVIVPKVVQATQAVQKFVDLERKYIEPNVQAPSQQAGVSIGNAADLAMANRNFNGSNFALRSIDPWYGPMTPGYPYSPYGARLAAAQYSPYSYSAGFNPALSPGGTAPVLSMTPYPAYNAAPMPVTYSANAYQVPYGLTAPYPVGNTYAATRPMAQWPAWSFNQSPLFSQGLFRQNQNVGIGSMPTAGTIYPNPSMYPSANYASVASQTPVNSTLRPSTAPVYPSSNGSNWNNQSSLPVYRDPAQVGLPATVLR